MGETLLFNLTFGCEIPADRDPSRVVGICKTFGLPKRVLDLIGTDKVIDWKLALSQAECQLLNLARAVISNFEFMIVQEPFAHLTPGATTKCLNVFAEFVR